MLALLTNRWVLKIAAAAALITLVMGTVYAVYNSGYQHASAKGQLRFEQMKLEMAERVNDLNQQIASAEAQVIIEYVDRIQNVTETRVVFRDRIQYVPSACELSQGWVDAHDAAARADTISVDAASQTDQSGVTDVQALEVVAENYLTCEQTRQQLISLQRWIRDVGGIVNE